MISKICIELNCPLSDEPSTFVLNIFLKILTKDFMSSAHIGKVPFMSNLIFTHWNMDQPGNGLKFHLKFTVKILINIVHLLPNLRPTNNEPLLTRKPWILFFNCLNEKTHYWKHQEHLGGLKAIEIAMDYKVLYFNVSSYIHH